MNRKLLIFAAAVVAAIGQISFASGAPLVAYIRGANAPWYWRGPGPNLANKAAFSALFGEEGAAWVERQMSEGPGPFQPGSGFKLIYLEGGDQAANELNAFLNANRTAIEAWVDAGGVLLLNSAPNEGGNINFGFGGVTLVYPSFQSAVNAALPAHPIFQGPSPSVGTRFTGNWFGHSRITGPDVDSILVGGGSSVVLGEKVWGMGRVLFGGMTTPNFHSPQPQAGDLLINILVYGPTLIDTDGDGLADLYELLYGTDPNNAADPVLTRDLDGDGLDWLGEFRVWTNPHKADTDGDNVSDGEEVGLGTNGLRVDPVAIVEAGPGANFGTAYVLYTLTTNDPTLTGFRVYYGAEPGTVREDYPAFFDINNSGERQTMIDQRWGMQGSPIVYVRIAPIRAVNPLFIGALSNEVFTYFAGEPDTNSAGDQITFPGRNPNSGGAGVTDDSDDSDDLWGFCFVNALGAGYAGSGWGVGGLGLAAAALGGVWLRNRRKNRR